MFGRLRAVGMALLPVWLLAWCLSAAAQGAPDWMAATDLPADARHTLRLVKSGGPFPNERDGVVFGNYEKLLPRQRRGYYHEYTVRTPGASNRGARRIIAGGDPTNSGEYYYTDDHYASFRRIKE